MPLDTDVLYKLDLKDPPEQLMKWAEENIRENPDTKCLIIEDFRDMIYGRGECVPHRTDDAFLLRFLRARKFNVEAAHRLFVNYYRFKENNPEFFDGVQLKNLLEIGCDDIITVPPYREQTGRRILLYRMGNWDPEKYTVTQLFQATMAILELAILEQRAQILGGIGLFDMSNLTFQQACYMTPSIAHKIIQILVTSFPMKIHAIHIVFQPYIFDIVYRVFQPFLTGTMKDKLYLHGEDMESLHKYIDPKHLPEKYGGRHPDYAYGPWIEDFLKNEEIKNELRSLGYTVDELEYEEYLSDSDKSEGSSCVSD
ncbi:clavesin-2-like [Anthonomus grandis grandis]|uniref:clavesin-2-like n=1 Tax=Anthonomus grandis grandis TaxID=2921223 RepID=UPI002165518C|nr:clavesin-2-like [Anthonomus grandis grandis]